MRTVGNILWLVLAGLWLAIGYVLAGIVCFILIITIPFGIASFRMARYALWPYGRSVVRRPTSGAMSAIGNVIWFVLFGWWLALEHVLAGLLLCLTIIGIPFGIACFKMAGLALFPLGKQIVPTSELQAAGAQDAVVSFG
ncbi:YccF domain-containing protein [Angustibacter luteus]|uniref:YccF domain-containing protein n=1 Tax=Angustibacter luteus TaxID=658456 RepID=A0ABW1JDD2_9ACTN